MATSDTLLEDLQRSEIMLQLQLKAMRKSLSLQLQELKKKQTEELEKRIHQNSHLSSDENGKSDDEKQLFVGMRRSTSLSALTSEKRSPSKPKQRPNTCSPCERFTLFKTTQQAKEEADEAECKKKFCAVPVPIHIVRTSYQEMMELRAKERKQGQEERKLFLISIQKPFSFQEREKNKKEKQIETLNQVCQNPKDNVCVKTTPQRESKDPQQLKVCGKVCTRKTTQKESPPQTQSPKIHSADLTRKQKLGFLDEELSFQPTVIRAVPNFSRLHKALQTKRMEMQSKDPTKCQPFFLSTSHRPARKMIKGPETSQESKFRSFSRSKSLGALTALSADTLPTFITDAVRQRCAAIRKSMDLRESKNQESADWLKNYQTRSQSIRKAVTLHAKVLDPHSSLNDVLSENLKRLWEADQQTTREYTRELKDIKARVSKRPFLFAQLKQRNAKARAEQIYRSKLQKAGLEEQFVQENGELFRSDDDGDTETQSREENVDDGEKIEDVEEKSVKSKGEEAP
uniref:Family with sequence similarity 161, member B n=1 Tax=Nothobranchius kuhntae TaxID=321403 RepID=A0A1A8HS88_NOTKU